MRKQGNTLLIVIIIVLILGLLGYLIFYRQKTAPQVLYTPAPTGTPYATPQTYNNTKGLDTASVELDGTNLNQMDSELNLIAKDSASF